MVVVQEFVKLDDMYMRTPTQFVYIHFVKYKEHLNDNQFSSMYTIS